MFRRNKKENKAKLEHKLYLARENPEPIFDISECCISNVPSGVYSLCRVFLKETLDMSHNYLSSLVGGGNLKDLHLLKVLDLGNNAFKEIPEEIGMLKNILELRLNNNQLKKLPSTLCSLEKLRVLDVSNNVIRSLPDNMGDLVSLKKLNIAANKQLKQLPKSICRAQRLTSIILDSENFLYPPTEVTQKGIESIMKYICDDTGFNYVPPSDLVDSPTTGTEVPLNIEDDNFQAKIWKLEKIKEQKLQEFLEIERNNELLQQQEFELANAQKANRKKLLEDITQQQSKIDKELIKLQQEKDLERFKLVEQLQIMEESIDVAVNQLLSLNHEPLSQLLEQEWEEEQKLLAAACKYNESLRKDDILMAMQNIVEQETEKFKQFHENRAEAARNALEQELLSERKISEILANKDLEQSELVAQLQEDNELQKYAVAALLERGDARSWGLVQQVRLVESQLAALTSIEMDRRKLQVNEQLNDLSEKRLNLSLLLMDLLEKQNARRTQLLSTLKCLEDNKDDTAEDFWLRQYQQLLDRFPSGLSEAQKNINPALAEALLMAGVIHCLPFIAKWAQTECNLETVTEDNLLEAGITKSIERRNILEAFRLYSNTSNTCPNKATAPPIDEAASAPPIDPNISYMTSECVICMDQICQIIFVPCGHYCSCTNCSIPLVDCPLCRESIERKIRVVSA